MSDVVEILGSTGPFAQSFDWFRVRECQQEMADAVSGAISANHHLVAESGTGTGKTFAYLVPALLSEKKIIISTRTKNLQEQLFQQDVTHVCDALDLELDIRLLKGRQNYFCIKRYERATHQNRLFGDTSLMNRVHDWVQDNNDGDISEYPSIPSRIQQEITSTAQNCLGHDCEHWNPCYFNRSRINARMADVVIMNHSLLSLHLCNDTIENQVPGAEVIIIDEAHRFPEIAANAMGMQVSAGGLRQLCSDLENANEEGDLDVEWIEIFKQIVEDFIGEVQEIVGERFNRTALEKLTENPIFLSTFQNFGKILIRIALQLDEFADTWTAIENIRNNISQLAHNLHEIFDRANDDHASWYEETNDGFKISQIPLEPGKRFSELVQDHEWSLIFTSATLAVGEDFSFFNRTIGLEDAISVQWESPFDFREQSRIYFPPNLPDPNYSSYDQRVADVVKEVVSITKGRAFVLFTSYKSLNNVYRILSGQLDYKLLRQGTDSNTNLLQLFYEDGNAVLLATSSFWEGVDVRGSVLSCVIIAKLPFGFYTDPILEARRRKMTALNQNFFNEWYVPNAALTLKQGAGRLIRDVDEKGVLVICDPRVKTKSYGKRFLDSLPNMQPITNLNKLSTFLNS